MGSFVFKKTRFLLTFRSYLSVRSYQNVYLIKVPFFFNSAQRYFSWTNIQWKVETERRFETRTSRLLVDRSNRLSYQVYKHTNIQEYFLI